jgi:hypothetical protein
MRKVLLLACVLCLDSSVHGQQTPGKGKPVRETSAKILYKAPPETPDGLYRAADAVAVVIVNDGSSIFTGVRPWPVETEVHCTVVSVVKPSGYVGGPSSELIFRVQGGEVDRGTHVERLLTEQPPLIPGRKYLVALKADASSVLRPAFGPSVIFDVTDGKLRPQAPSRLAKRHQNASLTDFVASMKER